MALEQPDDRGIAPTDLSPGRVDCAVVIVTYNSARHVAGLLESLPAAAAGLTLRTIVVDNASADATVQVVRGYADVVCVEAGANLGYSAGINVGRKHAGEYSALLVLNPDLILEAGAVTEMLATLDEPSVGMVVPMLLDADGRRNASLRREPNFVGAIGDGVLGNRMRRRPRWLSEVVRRDEDYACRHSVDWATGAAMLVSADCDRAVGPWDERFFLYSEEVDYAARARAAGFRVEYQPAARARHSGAGSGQSAALIALMAVNRIRYMEKRAHRPRAYRVAVILHELRRSKDPAHRTALRFALRRSRWATLPSAPPAQARADLPVPSQ